MQRPTHRPAGSVGTNPDDDSAGQSIDTVFEGMLRVPREFKDRNTRKKTDRHTGEPHQIPPGADRSQAGGNSTRPGDEGETTAGRDAIDPDRCRKLGIHVPGKIVPDDQPTHRPGQEDDEGEQKRGPIRQQKKNERPDEVEMLLRRQTPGVSQFNGSLEKAGRVGERRNPIGPCRREHTQTRHQKGAQQKDEIGRQNAQRSPNVKPAKGDRARPVAFPQQQQRDQEPAEHKKKVDADGAERVQPLKRQMTGDHHQDRHGTQSVQARDVPATNPRGHRSAIFPQANVALPSPGHLVASLIPIVVFHPEEGEFGMPAPVGPQFAYGETSGVTPAGTIG